MTWPNGQNTGLGLLQVRIPLQISNFSPPFFPPPSTPLGLMVAGSISRPSSGNKKWPKLLYTGLRALKHTRQWLNVLAEFYRNDVKNYLGRAYDWNSADFLEEADLNFSGENASRPRWRGSANSCTTFLCVSVSSDTL